MEVTFETIYNEHHTSIYHWINGKIRNVEVAEELANDVFIKVHKHIESYDEEISKVSTWVYNIAKNILIDHLRKKNLPTNSISEMVDDDGNETVFYTDGTNPFGNMVNDELGSAISEAMSTLPDTYKPIADMFFIQELSHEEITKALDVPMGTVKGYIHRAKELLRTKLINLR